MNDPYNVMELRILNLEPLKAIVDNDPELIKEVTQLFLEQMPGYIETLQKACTAQQAEAIKVTAHTIKGSASYLGAEQLVMIAKQLEAKAQENRLADCEELVQALLNNYEEVKQALWTQL